mmetsp:Transcript_34670/g.102880  ORF Transcript_34670/g.102880 Transcript_34670/m.102880 type:complete len:201 (+) Transcript_34670:583-1185(+)
MPSKWFGRSRGRSGITYRSSAASSLRSRPSEPPTQKPSKGHRASVATDSERSRRALVRAAVNDPVHGLLPHVAQMLAQAACLPAVRSRHGLLERRRGGRSAGEVVERNDDVCAQRLLRADRRLWRQVQHPAVAVRAEAGAVLAHAHAWRRRRAVPAARRGDLVLVARREWTRRLERGAAVLAVLLRLLSARHCPLPSVRE